MHAILAKLIESIHFTGDACSDGKIFLEFHGCLATVEHSRRVALEAKRLAVKFEIDETSAAIAGWLHDVSAVFPAAQRSEVARELGLDVLPDEAAFPMIVHQKLSAVMAQEIFGITDQAILGAIGCHTTLKVNASRLDKIVFVADKIQWDSSGQSPFLENLLVALECSLDAAVLSYLTYLWEHRDTLPVVHPWMLAAHQQLTATINSRGETL